MIQGKKYKKKKTITSKKSNSCNSHIYQYELPIHSVRTITNIMLRTLIQKP